MKTIKFNKNFYSREAIEKAIKEWRDFANFEFGQGKKYYFVKIKDGRFKKNKMKDEFCNFVLGLMKK